MPHARMSAVLGALVVVAACGESLESNAACPALCPAQTVGVQNVTLEAVTLDTTVVGGLGLGTEPVMLLVSRGDTVDSRAVIRFDSLPSVRRNAGDTTRRPITFVDSVYVRLRFDSSAARANVPLTLDAYDVDTTANDTATAAVAALFRPDRMLASQSYAPGRLVDTVSLRLPNAPVLAKIQTKQRLRIGLRLRQGGVGQARILATESGVGPRLSLRTTADTAAKADTLFPISATPSDNSVVASNLRDYMLLVRGTGQPPSSLLAVGGLPGRRAYLRFNIPALLVDSSTVVRATLLLTQVPSPGSQSSDTIRIQPLVVVAGSAVADPARAAQIVASPRVVPIAQVRFVSQRAGEREIEVAPAFGVWRVQKQSETPRALVLQSVEEGASPLQALFYSADPSNDPAVRPKLRVSYTPRTRLGTP